MSFANLPRTLRFLPLGLLWGLIAGGLQTYHIDKLGSVDDQVNWLVPAGTIACTWLIATLLVGAMLKHELPALRWTLNWVIAGVASCAGGVALFWLVFILSMAIEGLPPAWSSPVGIVEFVTLGWLLSAAYFGTIIAIEAVVVALLLAPLSLLARRLILRRRSGVEPTGGSPPAQA